MDGKDNLTEKLALKERAEEDIYFAKRDRELIAKLKSEQEAEYEGTVRELARFRCPGCGQRLQGQVLHGVKIDVCQACRGAWLGKTDVESITGGEGRDFLASFLHGLMRLLEGGSTNKV